MAQNLARSFSGKDLLLLPSMRQSWIAAGKGGLDRPIYRMRSADDVPSASGLRAMEFLVLRQNADENVLLRLEIEIPGYRQRGVCGIALHTACPIPDTLLSLCEQLDFPLILLSDACSHIDLMRESLEHITAKTEAVYERTQEILKTLVDALSRTLSPEEVLHEAELATGFKYLMIRRNELISEDDIVTDVPAFLAENETALALGGQARLSINGVCVQAYISTCEFPEPLCIICMGISMQTFEADIYIIEKVCRVIGMGLQNSQTIREMSDLYQDRFLHSWLAGEFQSDTALAGSARSYGITVSTEDRCIVAVADYSGTQQNPPPRLNILKLRRQICELCPLVYVVLHEKLTLLIRTCPPYEGMDLILPRLHGLLTRFLKRNISLYLSSEGGPGAVPELYREAINICGIARHIGVTGDIISFKDLGIYALLSNLQDNSVTSYYQNDFLKPVREYDEAHDSQLIETLKAYYKNNCNAKLTASQTYIHYNTILYRLARIKEILDMDIDEPETKLLLQIALKLDVLSKYQRK